MKLLSFSHGKKESWGAVSGDAHPPDLGEALPQCPALADFIGAVPTSRSATRSWLPTPPMA